MMYKSQMQLLPEYVRGILNTCLPCIQKLPVQTAWRANTDQGARGSGRVTTLKWKMISYPKPCDIWIVATYDIIGHLSWWYGRSPTISQVWQQDIVVQTYNFECISHVWYSMCDMTNTIVCTISHVFAHSTSGIQNFRSDIVLKLENLSHTISYVSKNLWCRTYTTYDIVYWYHRQYHTYRS